MGWLQQLCLSWTILFAAAACVSCQDLRSTLREGNRTCPGEEVTFTCTIRGPSSLSVLVLVWSSDEYISRSLQLSTANVIGDIETSTSIDGSITATATVTNITNVNGELMLVSTLRITAVKPSTVTCSGTTGDTESIEFSISAIPGIPQRTSAAEISQLSDNVCIILVTWAPPANSDLSDIDQYIIYVPSRDIRDETSSTITTLTVSNCGDDIRVQVAAVSRVGCVGMNSSEVQPTLLDIPAVPTANGSATTDGGSITTSSQLDTGTIAGIVIGLVLSVLLSMVFPVLLYMYFVYVWGGRSCCPDQEIRPGYSELQSRSTAESLELATNPKTEDGELWELQWKALAQAKKCYEQQSVHTIQDLGTDEDRVRVPIWIDGKLDVGWKAYILEAVEAINKAAPGLSLSIAESNKNTPIVYILATDSKVTHTEGNIQMRFIPTQADCITKIYLGKWEDDAKKGIITRELLNSLGCNQATELGLTRFDPYSITLYQDEKAYKTARKKYREDPIWQLKRNPTKENTSLSGLDKVGLNLVYPPCILSETADNTRYKYTPKLGKNGMYYCERYIMNEPDDNYGVGYCGPDKGPNCPACRTIKSPKVEEIVAKGKWQGMTGRVYCGRLFTEPGKKHKDHGGICGINNGPACPDCDDLLNQETNMYVNTTFL